MGGGTNMSMAGAWCEGDELLHNMYSVLRSHETLGMTGGVTPA